MVDQPNRVTVAVERSWDSLANQLGTIAAFAEGKAIAPKSVRKRSDWKKKGCQMKFA